MTNLNELKQKLKTIKEKKEYRQYRIKRLKKERTFNQKKLEKLEKLEREIEGKIGRLEKKYYVRLLTSDYDNKYNYLNLKHDVGKYLTGSKEDVKGYQTKFTMEEIEWLIEEYNLDSFEIVEVKK